MSQGPSPLETDPRFPSGPWTGFFLMPHTGSQRHKTDLQLTFASGTMRGTGRDLVGLFTIDGRYDVADGKCIWTKRYLGKHDVYYTGYNEGKGIWGTWDIPNHLGIPWKSGFHIWPEGMGDPSQPKLAEEAEPPIGLEEEQEVEVGEPVGIKAQGRKSLGITSA
ncbi:MAG TPA: hypothetical protein VKS79_22795 [Gemmataceae bacterium]|nr:hypothetical protein [Gemmataceae bacterium]